MCIQTEYTLYTTPKYHYWFRAILGWVKKKKKNSEWDLDPPTHFHSKVGFMELFFLCKAPNWAIVALQQSKVNQPT